MLRGYSRRCCAAGSTEAPLVKAISRHPDLFSAAAAAALAVAGAVLGHELWRMTPSVPLGYASDGQLFLAMTKATLENGWYLTNPDLGFPLGSEWHDYPVASGDTIHLLLLHALSPLSNNFVLVLHYFYVLGYALTAISAFVVLRLLDISRGPAVVCATLFALLPYHLALQEAHPFVTAYWVVPIASYLVLAVLLDRPLFARRRSRNGLLAFATGTTFATLGACLVIGAAGSNYYSVFAAGLVLIAGLVAAVRFDWRRSLATSGVVTVAIVASIALNSLPNLIYEVENGSNGQVANRMPEESEHYSLSLFGLVVPSSGHRVAPLDELRQDYIESSPTPVVAASPGIGSVAALGLLWLLFFALASVVKAFPWAGRWRLHGAAAAAALISFLIGTTGGLSLLFAHVVTPQVRTWYRLHVFIAFFALLAVAALLELAVRRLDVATRGRAAGAALLAAVLVVGFLDQTNPTNVPAYEQQRAEFESDGAFVDSIEQELEPDAAVFQLPYVPFPEWWPESGMAAFDSFRGYLHSEDLRWSFGAMTARPENWQPGVIDESVAQLLPRISSAGFDGLVVDRRGYPDEGSAVESAIADITGRKALVSPDGRFAFFDLQAYGDKLERSGGDETASLRTATLSPLETQPGTGLVRWVPPNGNYSPNFQMSGTVGELAISNPTDGSRDAILEATLPADAPTEVEVTLPSGDVRVVEPGRTVRASISLPPGRALLPLAATRDAAPGLIQLRLYEAGIDALRQPAQGVAIQP
jgi:phosphoglycerol transferase